MGKSYDDYTAAKAAEDRVIKLAIVAGLSSQHGYTFEDVREFAVEPYDPVLSGGGGASPCRVLW